jgi:hypothetical protein
VETGWTEPHFTGHTGPRRTKSITLPKVRVAGSNPIFLWHGRSEVVLAPKWLRRSGVGTTGWFVKFRFMFHTTGPPRGRCHLLRC